MKDMKSDIKDMKGDTKSLLTRQTELGRRDMSPAEGVLKNCGGFAAEREVPSKMSVSRQTPRTHVFQPPPGRLSGRVRAEPRFACWVLRTA